ncbi:MAG: hypothetical protein RIQ53_2836 [Pseudomonadota bacterium]|jgi:hypothetical protein
MGDDTSATLLPGDYADWAMWQPVLPQATQAAVAGDPVAQRSTMDSITDSMVKLGIPKVLDNVTRNGIPGILGNVSGGTWAGQSGQSVYNRPTGAGGGVQSAGMGGGLVGQVAQSVGVPPAVVLIALGVGLYLAVR